MARLDDRLVTTSLTSHAADGCGRWSKQHRRPQGSWASYHPPPPTGRCCWSQDRFTCNDRICAQIPDIFANSFRLVTVHLFSARPCMPTFSISCL